MIKVIDFPAEPSFEYVFLNAGRGPGQFYEDKLPVHVAQVDLLPDGIDALILTADLQGRERFKDPPGRPLRLLGEVLPQLLANETLPKIDLPNPTRVGVLLAGDFYTVPLLDKRGGSGDVTSVWRAFAEQFQWVAGVPGNHDLFGEKANARPRLPGNAHYLDGTSKQVAGLKIAGLGGIIGNITRPHRRGHDDYFAELQSLVDTRPDILIMHDGPDGMINGKPGLTMAREILTGSGVPLTVRGHSHWNHPFAQLGTGEQIINVDCRVVILKGAPLTRFELPLGSEFDAPVGR